MLAASILYARQTAPLQVLSAGALEPGLIRLARDFETTGRPVALEFGTSPQLAAKLAAGATADLLIAPSRVVDQALTDGKAIASSRTVIGRVGAAVTVRRNAPVPNVGSVDALRDALLRADSVVYNRASTGAYLDALFAKMGIAEQLAPKTTRYDNGPQVFEHVLKGTGNEIGFGAFTEIKERETQGLVLVGPLPEEVQNFTTYEAVILSGAHAPEAARDFIRHLTSPAAKRAFAATGVS